MNRFATYCLAAFLLTGFILPDQAAVAQSLSQDNRTHPKHIKNKAVSTSTRKKDKYRTRVERDRKHHVVIGASYRSVGAYSRDLSRLCARGLFGQKKVERAGLYFKDEDVVVGGAHGSGWNLYDPTRKAVNNQHYWFFRQGYTNCEVYVVQTRGR